MVDRLLDSALESVTKHWEKSDQKVLDKQVFPVGVAEQQNLRYGTDQNQTLDLYYPEKHQGNLPVLIHFHGGGFFYGDKSHDRAFGQGMAARGFLVVNCNYRLAENEVKVWHQLWDCGCAAKWVESHLAKYHGDPERVFLSGGSAGAVFAVLLAVMQVSPRLRRLYSVPEVAFQYKGIFSTCGFFGYDSKRMAFRCQRRICFGKNWETHPLYQELLWHNLPELSQLPPVFLVSGHDDWLKSMTLSFDRLLTRLGVSHRLLFLPRGQKEKLRHLITIMRPDLPASQMVLNTATEWLLSEEEKHPAAMEKRA